MDYEMIDDNEMQFKPVADKDKLTLNYEKMTQIGFGKALEYFRELYADKWTKEYYEDEFLVTFPDGRSTRFTLTFEDIYEDDI